MVSKIKSGNKAIFNIFLGTTILFCLMTVDTNGQKIDKTQVILTEKSAIINVDGKPLQITGDSVVLQKLIRIIPDASNEDSDPEPKLAEIVEEMPEFKGGQMALDKFFYNSIRYPREAMEKNIHGKVKVSFIVMSDGSVSHAKIMKGVERSLDAEALRIVKNMPNWNPAKQRGKSVPVRMTQTIAFVLQ